MYTVQLSICLLLFTLLHAQIYLHQQLNGYLFNFVPAHTDINSCNGSTLQYFMHSLQYMWLYNIESHNLFSGFLILKSCKIFTFHYITDALILPPSLTYTTYFSIFLVYVEWKSLKYFLHNYSVHTFTFQHSSFLICHLLFYFSTFPL